MNEHRARIKTRSVLPSVIATLVLGGVGAWAFWPFPEAIAPELPAAAVPGSDRPAEERALPLEVFRSAILWPPRLDRTPAAPQPPEEPERRFQDLTLLAIVAAAEARHALLYSKQDDQTREVRPGETFGPFRVEAVNALSVDVLRGDDRMTLYLEGGPRALAESGR